MASLSKKNGVFHIRFRYGGKQYRRSLKTGALEDAKGAMYAIKAVLYRLTSSTLEVPERVDLADFVISGGTLKAPPPTVEPTLSLARLIEVYQAACYTKAPSTLKTEKIHFEHLKSGLQRMLDLPADSIRQGDLESHFQKRLALVAPDTVIKEQATVGQLFRWGVERGYLGTSPASKLAKPKRSAQRSPFRTMAEIKAIIDRGGLSPAHIAELWECLFLAPTEIASVLQLVRERAHEDFVHLLHAIPAYTGMRRGEVMRLRWLDVDLEHGFMTARSRKQCRQSAEVSRQIDLHPELKQHLLEWRKRRPSGQFVICRRCDLQPLDSNTANRVFRQPLLATDWCLNRRRRWLKIGYHTYRHSFASNLAAAGVDQRVIDEFMGHVTESMRRRYRHLFPKDRRSAIEVFTLQPPSSPIPAKA